MSEENEKTFDHALDGEEIISVKGFGLDWKCRDFQFALGQTHEHKGKVSACNTLGADGKPVEVPAQ
jgi:hypothetical protein